MLEKKPFIRYKEDKSQTRTISLKLNQEEQRLLLENQRILRQPKEGTAIKQMINIATKVLHDKKIMEIVNIIIENRRKNKRLGITDDLI